MNKRELVEVYLRKNNMAVTSGSKDSLLPIIPFFLVALGLDAASPHINPKFNEKRRAEFGGIIYNNLRAFQKQFYRCYDNDAELSVAIGDMMCEFEDYMAHDLEIFRFQMANFMFGFDDATRKVQIDLYYLESLVKSAQALCELVYGREDTNLKVALNAIPTLCQLTKPKNAPYTQPKSQADFDNSIQALANRILQFLTI